MRHRPRAPRLHGPLACVERHLPQADARITCVEADHTLDAASRRVRLVVFYLACLQELEEDLADEGGRHCLRQVEAFRGRWPWPWP